jgi:hypothetical protein
MAQSHNKFIFNENVKDYTLGCTGTPFLAEYQYRVRAGYGYTYHTGIKVPNTYQRAKLKFQKYGYVWVRQGYVWVPYGYASICILGKIV